MKKIATLIIIFLTLFSQKVIAQNFGDCGYEGDDTDRYSKSSLYDYLSDSWDKVRTPAYWIPNDTTPTKTILVNWIICRDDNGQNGWQDCPEFREQVELMFTKVNEWYSNSLPKGYSLTCEPTYNHITDTKIRFELNDIIFINNTLFNESCSAYDILDYLFANYSESREAMNHIFTMPTETCITEGAWGYYSTYDGESYVQTFYSMYSDWYVVWNDHIEHVAHEYGHAVGQHHTYNSEIRQISHYDFLDDVFGLCAEQSCTEEYDYDSNYISYLTRDCFWNYQTPPYPLMSGNNINSRYISPKSAGRMHRALSLYDYKFMVNNMPMHKYVKEKYPYSIPLVINDDETWDFAIKMYQDIVIDSNVTMTLSGEIKMPIDGKIIIKPGGKLIIDGGTITNAHYEGKWQGIQVWGNDTIHQHTIDGQCHQGVLEMKNGATIENAVCAVELWQPNNYHSEGGIIHAEDAVFRNNAKAVHAINYTNYNPINGNEMSYNASFKNCTFIIDSDYIGDEVFHKHIDLDRVNGIRFEGCSFSADRNVENVSQWCSGIAAYNAGFAVNSYCSDNTIQPCLDEYLTKSSFSGFHSGIYVRGGSTSYTYNVRNAEFTNNDRGIYAENTGYATIIKNDFHVGTNADCNFGIYADNVTGFCIEENNFYGNLQSTNDTYGIAVHNSNNYNSIYLNHFNNLTCGNIAIGNNKRSGIVSLSQSGIAYYCNTNTGNINDFCVIKDNSVSVNGIARSQGSSAEAAGNTFGGSQYHFYNDGDDVINYYYSLSKFQQPHGDKLYRVTAIAANDGNDCSSHYGNNPVVKSEEEMTVLNNDYQTSLSAYNSLEQLYTSRIDGGDTQAELLDINTATADDASRLRSQLLGLSPYLSQEVLTTAASRNDVFSTSTLFEILSANPDELKKDTLISYLENKDNPMPEYMTELLREIANGSTARTALESQMAKSEREYILAAGDIVRSNLNSEESDNEELRLWLGNMNDMASDRLAIATYIQESDFENALALAETLPDVYGLQGTELEEHNDYISILRLYETLDESGRDIMQLTETETEMLEEIADNGSGSSQSMAYAILSQNNETLVTAVNCPVLPTANNNSKRGTANLKSDMAAAMGMKVDFAPNPATAWTEIDYTLPLDEEKASLVITNALGVNVMTVELDGNQGRKTLYLEQLPAGVYTYFVKCGEYTITGKLMKK